MRFALAIALSTPALAATIYVDADHNSTSNGSYSYPYKTVDDALDHAQPGDTLQLLNGAYGASTIDVEDITILGADPTLTKFTSLVSVEADGAVFRDVGFVAHGLLHAERATTVHSCVFDGWGSVGLLVGPFIERIEVHDSSFANTDIGVKVYGAATAVIQDSTFAGHTTAVYFAGTYEDAAIDLRRNTIEGSTTGLRVDGVGEVIVRRNGILDASTAMRLEGPITGTIASNVLDGSVRVVDTQVDIAHNTILGSVLCTHDDWYDTSYWANNAVAGDFHASWTCEAQLLNNRFTGAIDPVHVDLGGNQVVSGLAIDSGYMPLRGSPLVGTAVSTGLSGMNRDFYGEWRDSTPEIGAVERRWISRR